MSKSNHRQLAEQIYDYWAAKSGHPYGPTSYDEPRHHGVKVSCLWGGHRQARESDSFWVWASSGHMHRLVNAYTHDASREARVRKIISVLRWLDDWAAKQTIKSLAELG